MGSGGGRFLKIAGGHWADATPVFDIKPYLKYTDSRPEASGSFAQALSGVRLPVVLPEELGEIFTAEQLAALEEALALDPRPGYKGAGDSEYAMDFAGYQVRFTVSDGAVTVLGAGRDRKI